jgi:hypothetical protein
MVLFSTYNQRISFQRYKYTAVDICSNTQTCKLLLMFLHFKNPAINVLVPECVTKLMILDRFLALD